MSWTQDEARAVGNALIGSWPGTITAWGKEAFALYVAELQARGLTAEQTLVAIRSWPAGSDFPPSAPNLAAAARKDPGAPTFDEALMLIRKALKAFNLPLTGNYSNEAEMLKARYGLIEARALESHPLVASFMAAHRTEELHDLVGGLGDEEYGSLRRRDLERAWDRHCEASEGREAVALASGRRDGLHEFNPLAALGRGRG